MRTLLAIDVPFYRDGLQILLSLDDGILVVGAVSAANAPSVALHAGLDLVLLDIAAEGAREVLRHLRTLSMSLFLANGHASDYFGKKWRRIDRGFDEGERS